MSGSSACVVWVSRLLLCICSWWGNPGGKTQVGNGCAERMPRAPREGGTRGRARELVLARECSQRPRACGGIVRAGGSPTARNVRKGGKPHSEACDGLATRGVRADRVGAKLLGVRATVQVVEPSGGAGGIASGPWLVKPRLVSGKSPSSSPRGQSEGGQLWRHLNSAVDAADGASTSSVQRKLGELRRQVRIGDWHDPAVVLVGCSDCRSRREASNLALS